MTFSPAHHWKLGLFVVIGVVLAVGSLVYLGAESLRRQHVTYTTYFDESVQGLDVGAPVYFRGVEVGQVSGIGVAPDARHVSVTCALFTRNLRDLGLGRGDGGKTEIAVTPELRVQLVNVGITGMKALQLDFFAVASNPAPDLPFPVPDRYIPAATSTLGHLETAVVSAADRFPAVADAILKVANHADQVLDQLERAHLPEAAVSTLAKLDRTLAALQTAIAQADVGKVSAQARADLDHLDAAIQHFDKVLIGAQRSTDAVADAVSSAPEISEEMIATLHEIQEAAQSFRRLTDAIERDPDMLLKGRQ